MNLFETMQQYGISPNVVFSTIVTISIFILGFALNRWNEWRIERKRLKETRMLILEYLSSLLKPIDKHIEDLELLANSLGDPKIQTFSYREDAIRSHFIFGLPQIDVFRSLVYGRSKQKAQRIVDLNLLLDCLEFFERSRPLLKRQFEYLVEYHAKYHEDWNSSVDPIARNYERWRSEQARLGKKPSEDQFVLGLDRVIASWQQQADRYDWEHMHSNLVAPAHLLATTHSSDDRAITLLGLTVKATSAIMRRRTLFQITAAFFMDHAKVARKRSAMIQEVLARYKNDGQPPNHFKKERVK